MDEKAWESFFNKLKAIYEKEDKEIETFEQEKPVLEKVLLKIEKNLENLYDFIEPIGRGGAGIVIRLKDKGLHFNRALKVPRPKEEKLLDSVKNEIEHLNKLRHDNVITIYNLGEVKIENYDSPYPYFVMDYIEDAKDIRKKVEELLTEINDTQNLKMVTSWVAEKFYGIAQAIYFLHSNNTIHFDIKPSNILIDKSNKPILSDLGFAKKKADSDEQPIIVGFTYFYAHPILKAEYFHMSSKNRVRKPMLPKDFHYVFDIYACGKSLLEILSLIDREFSDIAFYDYNFIYLHLLACRMLDGRNITHRQMEEIRSEQLRLEVPITIFKETWWELTDQDFEKIKYGSFDEICQDFKKLLFSSHFINKIPELNEFYPKRIQSSQGAPAPFSNRVKCIVEHPVFSRLSFVPHLSLLNSVYPTATHTRLEHSMGAFRNCILYVNGLYNDSYNPIFKQLVNEEDLKCILLASLIHDLGHYPLAHEMEEYSEEFKHEVFTLKFLDNPTKNKDGFTLKDIIENQEWGWGVKVEELKKMLAPEKKQRAFSFMKELKANMLSTIIDGPIDVDKLDYLLRDSQNCYLKYGEFIDLDRIIRNLTVVITKNPTSSSDKSLVIGTYEKGQSAAESLTFSRYLLYQSLYWHHTARAIRAMLREAVVPSLKKEKRSKYKTFVQEFEHTLGVYDSAQNLTIEKMLELVVKWTDEIGCMMINMIEHRNFYKRILTIHSDFSQEKGKISFLQRFRNAIQNPCFQDSLQNKILEKFANKAPKELKNRASLLSPSRVDDTIVKLKDKRMIICDCPEPIYGTEKKLRFIPEPQRLLKNYFIRSKAGERVSEVWNEVYYILMNIASKGRVFCHPDIRDTLMAAIGPDGIKESLEELL